jgi:hypothetical protein
MPVKVNVFKAIMEEFAKERDGKIIDDLSLKQVIQMIIQFRETMSDESDFYTELEEMFIKETSKYYNICGKEYLQDYT